MIALFSSRTVAINLFGYAIHWYGVMYALAFWIAYALLPYLGTLRGLKFVREQWTMLIVYAAAGVLVGGRAGYVLFYEPAYFFMHPGEVFAIWHGGMSSHGGFIGAAAAVWLWTRFSLPPNWGEGGDGGRLRATTRTALTPSLSQNWERGTALLAIADVATVPAAIGLALGRIGNFINQELYSGYGALYDAATMIVIAATCYAMLYTTNPLQLPLRKGERRATPPYEGGARGGTRGEVISIFLILYSITRFLLEYIRIQEWPYIFGLTRGQFFTIPLFLAGMLLFWHARTKQRTKTSR